MIELVSAEEKIMRVIGTTKLRLMAPGGGWKTTVALVCPKLSHQFLMSWVTQKKLQLLHPGWPFSLILETNLATISEFQTTPKCFRPRDTNPDPQTPIWPKPEWLMLRVLGCFGGGALTCTKHSMPAYGCRVN